MQEQDFNLEDLESSKTHAISTKNKQASRSNSIEPSPAQTLDTDQPPASVSARASSAKSVQRAEQGSEGRGENESWRAAAIDQMVTRRGDMSRYLPAVLSRGLGRDGSKGLPSDRDQEIIDKEQELVAEELKNSGKPEDIAKKISLGKMNKFKEENALLTQAWVMEPKKKVQDVLKELSIADLKIKEFYRIKIGE